MKVYIVDSVEIIDDEVFAYIYPKNRSLAVFPSFEKAFEFCKSKDSYLDWDIDPDDLYTKVDSKDQSIHYVYERENEKTLNGPELWAVIIEKEMEEKP